jgi:DNA-binding CsgD family transcriptional regulator
MAHPDAAVVSLVCSYQPSEDRMAVFSTGACTPTGHDTPENRSRIALSMQDRSERLTKLDLDLPDHATSVGLVAPLSALSPAWSQTPLARIITGANFAHPILHVVPIKSRENNHLTLMNIFGFTSDRVQSPPSEPLTLISAIHNPLRIRAVAALGLVDNPRAWLTDREHNILEQLIRGHSVRVIAEQLGRSSHTVHDHVKNLHRKIDASSRGELIAKALGHTPEETQIQYPDPITIGLTNDQPIAEIKPERISARPLRG